MFSGRPHINETCHSRRRYAELPEVETSRRGIEPHLVNYYHRAHMRNGRLRWPVSDEIYRLSDTLVLSVQRRAKYLLLELLTAG